MGRKTNLTNLSEDECEKILHVIERDFELRQRERDRLGQLEDRLKTEEDRAKLLTSRATFNQSCCVRCCQVFGLIFNRRQQCFLCRFFVCKRCGTYSHEDKAFVCFACLEQREFKRRSCDWFYSSVSHKHKRFGSAKVVRSLYKRKSSSDTEFDSGYDPSQFSSLQLSATKARPALGDVFDLHGEAQPDDQELPLVASSSNGVSRPVSRASSLQSLLPASSRPPATPNSATPNSSTPIGHNATPSAFNARLEDKTAATKSRKTTKDVYHEAFEKARKVEEARFKARFDSLIADVRKSLETQNPDLDITSSFGSTSYAEVMISFRSRLRELLVGHYQRLQLAYESFDVTQSENDHGPAVRKNVSVLVENLVGETLDLTSDEAVSDLSSLSEDSPPDQHSFADHIAQVIVAKILDSHRREVSRTISSEGHDDQEGHQNGLDLPDSGLERARTTTRNHHDDEEEDDDDDVSDVVRQFEELRNFAQASHPRPEPVARDIEERVSPSPVEEDPLEKVSVDKEEAQEDFLTRCQTFDRVRNSPGPDFSQFDALSFGTGEIDPDLLSMNLAIIPEETEEELEQEDEGQWKDNWIFKGAGLSPYDNCGARKIRTEDDRPLYMMVPQPDDNLIPRIGNRDADQLSDLSENEDGKSTDDLSDDENTFYSKTSEELRRISRKTATAVQTEESDLDSPRGVAARRDSGTQSALVSRGVDVSLDSSLPLVDKPRLKLLEDLIPADNDDPRFLVPPESATILEGEVLKLSCRVAGTPPVGVFWYQETEEVEELEDGEDCDISSEGDRHTLTLYNLRRSQPAQFMCIALNDAGKCTKYFAVTVKENKQDLKAPEFIKGLQDVEVREGQSVKFRCKVKGIPLPRITWYKDGRLLRSSRSCRLEKFGNRDYILSLDCASMEDDAEYSVVARNIRGEARSSAQVIVEPAQEAATTSSRLTATKTSVPEDSLERLTRRMSEERDRMAETASSLLGTAEEKSAKSVRLLTSSALDVLRAAEEIIQSEKEDSGRADFVTSTPRAPPSPPSSRRDVINNNDVTDSLLEGDAAREDSVLYLTGSTLQASSTDGLIFGSSRDHSDGARVGLRLSADERAEDRLASGQRVMGGESSLDTSVADADTSADLSLSDFALRPEDFSGEEVLNFGPKPVDPRRYRRDYEVPGTKEGEEVESPRHWEVKMNAFSPQAEIINRREATNNAEEKIYMAAGRVFALEDRVRELEDRVADCDPSDQELGRLEREVARAVAQAAQSEREVSSITLSVSELQQQHGQDKGDNSSQASTPRQSVDSGFSSLRERPAPVVLVGHSGEGDVPATRGEYNLEEGVELPSVHRLRAMFSQKPDPDLGDGSFLRVHSITARSLAKAQQQQQQQQQHQGAVLRERPPVQAEQARSTAQLQLSLPPSPSSLTETPSGPGLPRAVLRRSQVGADSSSFQPLEPEKTPVLIFPRSSSKSHPAPSPPQPSHPPTPTPAPRQTVTASRVASSQPTSSTAAARTAASSSTPAASSTPSASSSTPSASSSTPSAESAGATASAGAAVKKMASPRIRSGCISARAAFWEKRISEGNMSDCSVAEEFPDIVEDDSSESQA